MQTLDVPDTLLLRASVRYQCTNVVWLEVALQLTVVTSTTVQSSVAVPASDARVARVVPSVAVAHETTAVRALSSNGR
jgi:hypothetical protein